MTFRTKGFVSLLLACLFLTVSVSGVALYMSPKGRVANWTGWTVGGLGKHEWEAVHMNMCLLMLIIVAVHLFLNWKVFWSYIKKKAAGFNLKLEMAVALAVTVAVVAGTLMEVPPLTAPPALNDRIQAYWEENSPRAPAPHAEEFTVARFAQHVGLSVEDVTAALAEEGLLVEDTSTTIGALAKQNGMAPSDVQAAVTKHFPDAIVAPGPGRGRGRGMGGPGGGQGPGRGGWGQGQGRGQGRGQGSGPGPKAEP